MVLWPTIPFHRAPFRYSVPGAVGLEDTITLSKSCLESHPQGPPSLLTLNIPTTSLKRALVENQNPTQHMVLRGLGVLRRNKITTSISPIYIFLTHAWCSQAPSLECDDQGQEPHGRPFPSTVMAPKEGSSVCECYPEFNSEAAISLSLQCLLLRALSLGPKLFGSQICLFFGVFKRPIRQEGFEIPSSQGNRSYCQMIRMTHRDAQTWKKHICAPMKP